LLISVIIPNHNRKEFLVSAVESVLGQNFPKAEYELIVSTNNVELDSFLSTKGIKVIHEQSEAIGAKVAKAIEVSDGEIICFLDDDDLFMPHKLKEIYELFSKNEIDYHHNDSMIISKAGDVIEERSPWMAPLLTRLSTVNKVTILNKKDFVRSAGALYSLVAYNSSSTSLRRELIIPLLNKLSQIRLGIDLFYFFSSLSTKRKIAVDGRILTKYRVHGKNSASPDLLNFDSYIETKLEWLMKVIQSRSSMLDIIPPDFMEVKDDQKMEIITEKLLAKSMPSSTNLKISFNEYLYYIKKFLQINMRGKRLPIRTLIPFAPTVLKKAIWYSTYKSDVRRYYGVKRKAGVTVKS